MEVDADPLENPSATTLANAAALHGTATTDVQLTSRYQKRRQELERTDEHCSNYVRHGTLLQINTINQFSHSLTHIIQEFNHPTCCCGAMAMAYTVLLSRVSLPQCGTSDVELDVLTAVLRDMSQVLPEVGRAMRFVYDARKEYIDKHLDGFNNEAAKSYYMNAWVANYEISDYLRCEAAGGRLTDGVFFLRYNQWPERDSATHEEKERLVEEQRFGGEVKGDKGSSPLEPWASRFIIECFSPSRKLLSHAEAAELFRANDFGSATRIFLLDLNGHFNVAIPMNVCGFEAAKTPTLLVVNTTDGSYLTSGPPAVAFDLAFPAQGPSPDAYVPCTKQAAVAMGAEDHFTVRPLDKCPHVLSSLNIMPEDQGAAATTWLNAACQECGSIGENMLCLQCHAIFCGRYVKQHSLAHASASKHSLVLGLADLSVWCYSCDNFLDSYLISDLHAVYSSLHQAKFGSTPSFPSAAKSMAGMQFDAAPATVNAQPFVISEESLGQLTEMGFDPQLCRDVLTACRGNVDQALNSLMG